MKPLVTVLIPNYNETGNVKRGVLKDVYDYLRKQSYGYEILISDDGSTDGSLELIKKYVAGKPNFKVIENKHEGKPYALRSGINSASGKYILLTDMDQSTPISELGKLLEYVDKGYDIVIGSRGSERENSSFFRKYVISWGFLTVRRLILLPELIDTQCGFKLVETELAKEIFSRMRIFGRANNAEGWKVTAYDVELLHIGKKLGHKIKEVRVIWKDEDTSVGKKRNFVKESAEMLFEIMRVRVNDILGKYD